MILKTQNVFWVLLVLMLLPAGCGPRVQALGSLIEQPFLENNAAIMADGTRLPLDVWRARKPRAVMIGVHGMNGYAADFKIPAPWFADKGISVYAYDQRSFGRTDPGKHGIWPGSDVLISDLHAVYDLVRARHKGLPVYILGLSMGGAVTMAALGRGLRPSGVILAAPAVWGWRAMNPFLKSTLWVTAHVAPGFSPPASNLDVWPSDNIEMLREISRDPVYIKETRTDAIYGLVTLMDEAYEAAGNLNVPVLFLYGKHDQIVPRDPSRHVMREIPEPKRVVIYDKGWHMVLRDKQRQTVWQDMLVWLTDINAPLPSGEEVTAIELSRQ
jgi:acylglycerol lipase